MASSNVDFYEKIKQLQDVQYESEVRRQKLEKELNSHAVSDQRLARLKAVQLQNYWKKICENEKKSNWRNEQLVRDFERVESQMASLSARTERLRTMKKQYEDYIDRMYPDWKQRLEAQRLGRTQQTPVSGVVTAGTGLSPGLASLLSQPPSSQPGINLPNLHLHHNGIEPPSINAQPLNKQPAHISQQPGTFGTPTRLTTAPQPTNTYQIGGTFPTVSTSPYNPPTIPPIDLQALNTNPTNPQPATNPYLMDTTINSTLQTVSSLPTGVSMTSTHGELMRAYSSASQEHTMKATDDEEEEQVITSPKVTVRKRGEGQSETYVVNGGAGDTETHPKEPESARKDHDEEDGSEIGTDVSLPLSGSPDHSARPQATPRSTHSQGSVKSQGSGKSTHSVPVAAQHSINSQLSQQDSVEDRSVYPEADVTLEGFYNLLEVVQDSLGSSRSLTEFYRAQNPAPSVTKDIIHNANKGATLSHLDPVSVSMVVLDQLPLVVANCENNCLIPDEFLFSVPANLNKDVVRSRVHRASQVFWDHMYDHLSLLVRHKVMGPDKAAEYFGPLLIADDSPYEESVKFVLTQMLRQSSIIRLLLSLSLTKNIYQLSITSNSLLDELFRMARELLASLKGQCLPHDQHEITASLSTTDSIASLREDFRGSLASLNSSVFSTSSVSGNLFVPKGSKSGQYYPIKAQNKYDKIVAKKYCKSDLHQGNWHSSTSGRQYIQVNSESYPHLQVSQLKYTRKLFKKIAHMPSLSDRVSLLKQMKKLLLPKEDGCSRKYSSTRNAYVKCRTTDSLHLLTSVVQSFLEAKSKISKIETSCRNSIRSPVNVLDDFLKYDKVSGRNNGAIPKQHNVNVKQSMSKTKSNMPNSLRGKHGNRSMYVDVNKRLSALNCQLVELTAWQLSDGITRLMLSCMLCCCVQAKRVLKALLDDLPADPLSPGSTTTFDESYLQPAIPAKPATSVDSDAILMPSVGTFESEPPEDQESEESDEDFFSKPVPNEGVTLSTGSLTQSDAYRRMLGDTMSSQKSAPVVDTDESDESDVEKMLNLSRSGPRMSFQPEASSTMIGTGATEPDSLQNTQSKDEELSEASSPAISGGGYVPSAMGQTGASTVSQVSTNTNKSNNKKPAFMYAGDSDTDEDVALHQQDKKKVDDDFDFYG